MRAKMAEDLDRVRISAAELRAEASNSTTVTDCLQEEQQATQGHQPLKKREGKRPELPRYQPAVGDGRHRCNSEERDAFVPIHNGESGSLESNSSEPTGAPTCERKSDKVSECRGPTNDQTIKKNEDRLSGDGSNGQNCAKICHPQSKSEENQDKGCVENDREHQETAMKPTRRARKPDQEFYQPGSRRSIQAKESRASREDKPPPRKPQQNTDSVSLVRISEKKGVKSQSLPQQRGKENEEKVNQEKEKTNKSSETSRKQQRRDTEKSPLPSDVALGKITTKVERLSIKENVNSDDVERDVEESGKRSEAASKGMAGDPRGRGAKEEEKIDKKKEKGSRKKRGVEKGKEGNQDSRRRRAEDAGGKTDSGARAEREMGRRAADTERENIPTQSGEGNVSKGRMKQRERESRRECNTNKPREKEKSYKSERNIERASEASDRHKSNTNATTPSKRYSKSDIRHSRNRTYSSSSASSVTSLDSPRQGRDCEAIKRQCPGSRQSNTGAWSRDGGQNRLQFNGESSTESMEESEMSDVAEDRIRRRRRHDDEIGTERQQEDRNKPRVQRGVGRGILKVSLENQSNRSPHKEDAQSRKQGGAPRGRGGGILVLPSRTNTSNPPEFGSRLLFGGARGASASRGRTGRGGGVRRLWDPNNPDQKPALTSPHPTQHSPLQQPMYLQSGTGYGQLHFLDTDDEVAGSPPVAHGEHMRSQQQAAAMAYYKFQNSDNPYSYPVPSSSPHSPGGGPSHRYPYPYQMAPYQMTPPNGMYQGPGLAQLCGGYRGTAYAQQGGGMSPEEAEQQARGELGRMLRAADAQELQLSNLLSRDRLSAEGLDRMAQLRADLLVLYEQVILTDIEYSDSQSVDQALWKNVFYQVIEHFRQLLKDPAYDNSPHIRNMLLTLLDEGARFFDKLLQKLQTVFQFKMEDYMDGMAIRARPLRKTVKYALISAQRCMICQGDIARYREQASDSANYGKARSWYLKAQQIAPKNGRPYNQLALLAVYTKRKLDAVYYYMRSLAASNPILTAKESLMSLFEEAKRKIEQLERRKKQESEGGFKGPAVRGRVRGEEAARVEIWIRPSKHNPNPSSHRGGSESSRDSEQDGELGNLNAGDLKKRFILSFLHTHGKLFTKVGMESFAAVASRVLQEFKMLLQHGTSLLGSPHLLQIITINMFTIHNALSRCKPSEEGDTRSMLQEQSTALGLGMFALLVQRCTELLTDMPAEPIPEEDGVEGEEMEGMKRVSTFPADLKELLPSIKVWSDWMLGHPDQWNPPPCSIDGSLNVWQCLADLCNVLAHVDHGEVPLYKADTDESEGDEELTVLLLEEDRLLAGFVPLLAAPQEPCYIDRHTDVAIAADCKRVTVLKYFLEALCGQEEPLLAFKGGRYISVAACPAPDHSANKKSRLDSLTEKEGDDVIVEAEMSLSASEGEEDVEEEGDSENDIKELRARRYALASELAQRQKRRDKIQAVLQTGGQLELEVHPLFLVPDTNGFIDHLNGLKKLLQCGTYILIVPLIVITELDGLTKGQDNFGGGGGSSARGMGNRGNHAVSAAHVRAVQEKAWLAVEFLEKGFESRERCLRALTSKGNQLESIAFRSEDTSGQQGNNDDVILSCCLHFCKDKAKDFMPEHRNGPVRLRREVVLLTDDRNLRVKALTRNVPVRDIPSFLSWAKVG